MPGSLSPLTRNMSPDPSLDATPSAPRPGGGASFPEGPEPLSSRVDEPSTETSLSSAELILAQLESSRLNDRRRFRIAAIGALIFHLVLFFVTFPSASREPKFVGKPGKVFVMKQARFKKPPAKAAPTKQEIPKKKAKKIPIPDPTPDEPEPIVEEEIEIPDLEPTNLDEVVFGIPDAPPSDGGLFGTGRYTGDAMEIGDGVPKPIAISKPQPLYTEEARQRRIQGVVILQGIVDEEGNVRNLKVVKGLPFGLDQKAIEGVYQWKFKPSIHEGKPVAVHFYFTVNYWLQ